MKTKTNGTNSTITQYITLLNWWSYKRLLRSIRDSILKQFWNTNSTDFHGDHIYNFQEPSIQQKTALL